MAENLNASAQSVNVDIFDGDSVRGSSKLTSRLCAPPVTENEDPASAAHRGEAAQCGPGQRTGRLHWPEVVEIVESFEPPTWDALGHQRRERARAELAEPAHPDRHGNRDLVEAVVEVVGAGGPVDRSLGRASALDAHGAVRLRREAARHVGTH